MIQVEVVFASEHKQKIVELNVPENTTASEAIQLSGIQNEFHDFDFSTATIGIYGTVVPRNYLLANNDRVEIYRPLKQSPTDARRKRAATAISKKK